MAKSFSSKGLKFVEQLPTRLNFQNEDIAPGFADFLVEDSVVVELKRGKFFFPKEIAQTLRYIQGMNYQLAIIIRFTTDGVRFKRVVNLPDTQKADRKSTRLNSSHHSIS